MYNIYELLSKVSEIPINMNDFIGYIGLFIVVLISVVFILIFERQENPMGSIIFILLTFLSFSVILGIVDKTNKNYVKNSLSYDLKTINYEVEQLPNEIFVVTNSFIVDDKEINVIKDDNTTYFKDSNESPYIIVDELTTKIPHNYLLSKKTIEILTNQTIYILKEVHY